MTIIRKASAGLALAGVLMLGAGAHALSPAEKCESSKLKTSAKYSFCRLKLEADAVKSGGAPDFSKCDGKFSDKWGRAESSAMGQCPSTGDQAAIQALISQCTDDVAAIVAGGAPSSCAADLATCNVSLMTCTSSLGTCDGDLTTCNNDLSTSQTSLTTCNGNLTTCSNDLSGAQSSLTTCTGDLSTCNGNLTTCTNDLSTSQGNLATCTGNLVTCSNDLSAAHSDLATCTGDLGTCTGDLATCSGDLASCNNALSTAQSDLTTCNNDLSAAQGSLATCTGDLSSCQGDLSTCQAQPLGQRLKTGQTTCYNSAGTIIACAGSAQDGELQKGLPRTYVDNGDGTVTDQQTGLMWEKLSDDGSIQDKDNTYSWANAFTRIDSLNTGSFAGHSDWRLPNVHELHSLVNNGAVNPAVNTAFNTGCAASCIVTACSCTGTSVNYWSSTSFHNSPSLGWRVRFFGGSVDTEAKSTVNYVRAVRGGS